MCLTKMTLVFLCLSLVSVNVVKGNSNISTNSQQNTNSSAGRKTLNFMAFFPVGSSAWSGAKVCLDSTKLGLEHINGRDDILADYQLNMTWRDTKCNEGIATDEMYELLYTPPTKMMVFGAGCSTSTQATAHSSYLWNLTQLSYGSSSPALSDRKRYPRFFRMISSATLLNVARVHLMKLYDWRKVSTIHEAFDVFSDVTYDLMDRIKETNISLITAEVFKSDPTLQLQNLKNHDARIIMVGIYENKARQAICQAYRLGMRGPKVIWLLPGWYGHTFWRVPDPSVACSADEMTSAVEGAILVANAFENPDQVRGVSGFTPSEWLDMYTASRNITRAEASALCYDGIWALAMALNNTVQVMADRGFSKTLNQFEYSDGYINDVITDSLYNLSFMALMGPVVFTETGEGVSLLTIEHITGGVRRLVGIFNPLNPEEEQLHWIGDGIQWPGGVRRLVRIFNPLNPEEEQLHWIGDGIQWPGNRVPKDSLVYVKIKRNVSLRLYIVMSVAAGTGILLSLALLVFNIIFRGKRIIKLSSPNINNLILLGCIESYITVFLETLDENALVFCKAKTFMLAVAFSTIYGALLSKTWRVHKIFSNTKLKKVKLRDGQLFVVVCSLVAVQVLILMVWYIVDEWRIVTIEASREVSPDDDDIIILAQLDVCQSANQLYFSAALYGVNGLMLAFGAFLAWETRKVKVEALNDSQFIGFSIYNAAILSGVVALLSAVLTNQRNLVFGLTSGFLILGVTVTQLLIFVPKIINLNSNQVVVGPSQRSIPTDILNISASQTAPNPPNSVTNLQISAA